MGGGRERERLASPVVISTLECGEVRAHHLLRRVVLSLLRDTAVPRFRARGDAQDDAVRPGAADAAPNFLWLHGLPRYFSIFVM